MQVEEIFNLAIKLGVKNDLRGEKRVQKNLEHIQTKYNKFSKDEKRFFDKESLINPYLDSRVHYDSKKPVKTVLAGIDIDTSELLLVKELGDIDLVIAHHPLGKSLARLNEVMALQIEVLADYGVPINIAQSLLKLRIDEVARGVNPINHYKVVDAARLLNISLMNVHTITDNMVANFLKKNIEKKKFVYVGHVMEVLKEIPEYREAIKRGFGPRLFAGSEDNYCGKIAITEITGGSEGSAKIYEKLAQAGIGTVIGMHMSEEHKKQAERSHINVIIAGHISSDSLGMNLFLDELEKKGLKIKTSSGLIRVKRI